MKCWLVWLWCLLAATAAQAWCTMPPPANPASGPPVQIPQAPLQCWPAAAGIGGSGKGFLRKDIAAVPGATAMGGSAMGWWCPQADGSWKTYTVACLSKYCPGTVFGAVGAALAAASPGAALQAVMDAYAVRVTDWSETNDYNCLHVGMVAALQATKPATAPAWAVFPSGSSVYPVVNGKLGAPVAGLRAAGGLPCNCASPVNQFGYTYCAFQGGAANQVAMCVKP